MKPNRKPPPQPDHIGMMKNLGAWPRWPWLPLKRYVNGGMPDLGALHADYAIDCKPRVYFINVFGASWFPHPKDEFKEYDNLEAMIADGWIVD